MKSHGREIWTDNIFKWIFLELSSPQSRIFSWFFHTCPAPLSLLRSPVQEEERSSTHHRRDSSRSIMRIFLQRLSPRALWAPVLQIHSHTLRTLSLLLLEVFWGVTGRCGSVPGQGMILQAQSSDRRVLRKEKHEAEWYHISLRSRVYPRSQYRSH